MIDDMGIFRTTIEVAPWTNHEKRLTFVDVMVDTGSEYNWIPGEKLVELGVTPVRIDRFETADGRILERPVGFALIFAGGRSAPMDSRVSISALTSVDGSSFRRAQCRLLRRREHGPDLCKFN